MKHHYNSILTSIIITLFISFQFSLHSQGVSMVEYVQGGSSIGPIHVTGSVIASNGDVYVSGKFEGAANIGSTSLVGTLEEAFVARFSSTGQLIWVRTGGGAGDDGALDIALDDAGGVYVCGYFGSTATFGTITVSPQGTSNFGEAENFLAKYDTAGNVSWVKHGTKRRINNPASTGNSKVIFKNGELFYMSYFEYRVSTAVAFNKTFDGNLLEIPGGSTFSNANVFVVNATPAGVINWATSIVSDESGFQDVVISDDMDVKSNGHVLIQGRARSGIEIGTTTITYSGTSNMMFLVELDTAGDYHDDFHMDDIGFVNTRSYGLSLDSMDNAYALNCRSNGGAFPSVNGKFFPTTGTTLMRLDNNLTLNKIDVISTLNTFSGVVTALDVSNDGNIIVGGFLTGSMSLAGTAFSASRRSFYASCDTAFTQFNWIVKAQNSSAFGGSTNTNIVTSAEFDTDNSAVFTGYLDLSNTTIGNYSSGLSTHNGYMMRVVDCYPQTNSLTPLNPVICGTGGAVVLNGSFNSSSSVNWLSSGIKLVGATSASYVVNNPGNYALLVDSLGCMDTTNVATVTVESLPTVSTPGTSLSVCSTSGQVVIPDGTPAGGTWSGVGVVNDSLFDPSITGAGPSIITYTYTSPSGCSASAIQIANVVVPPTLLLTSSLPSFCENDPAMALGSMVFPAGGTYSGTGVNNNSFVPSTAGVGTHVIKYWYSAGLGCADSVIFNLVVNPSPIITFPTFNDLCNSVFSIPLNQATPIGGTYTGNFIISNNFYPFLSGAGTFPITYNVTQSGCTSSATENITVDAPVTAALAGVGPYCIDDTIHVLSEGSPAGGVYLVNGVVETQIEPSALGVSNHVLKYAFTNACGTDTVTLTFDVFGLPVVNLLATGPYCENESTVTLNQGTPSGGTYYGSVVNSGNFNPASAGVGSSSIYYTYTDVNGCINLDSTVVVVNAKPMPVLTVDTLLCVDNGLETFNSSIAGGTWSGTGIAGNTFDPAAATVGVHSITYNVTNAAGCIDTSNVNVEVFGLPTVSLNSFAPICNTSSASIPLTGGTPLGGIFSGVGVNTGFFNPAVSGSGFHLVTYTYTDLNGCAASDTATMTVDTTTVAVNFLALNNVCVDASPVVLSGGSPTGGSYSGTAVTAGSFDPSTAGVGVTQVYYSYAAPNACIATEVQTIIVDSLPIVSFDTITDVCVDGAAVTLSTGTPVGGIYAGTGVSLGDFTPSIAGVGSHALVYTFIDLNNCSNSNNQNIEVNPLPAVALAGFAPVCYDSGMVALTGGTPIGGAYSGLGITSGSFDPIVAGAGAHVVTYAFTDTNGCLNSAVDTIKVYQPSATLATFNDLCADAPALTLTGGSPLSGVYSGVGVSIGQFDASAAGVGTTDIYYTVTDNGCVAIDTQSITVNALPVVSLSGFFDACESDTAIPLGGGFPALGVFTGTAVNNGVFNANIAGQGFHTITYTFTDAFSCVNQAIDSIRVNPNPTVSIGTFSDICLNESAFTLAGGLPSTGSYFGTGVSNGIFDPSISGVGTFTISFTDTNGFGCSSVAIDSITVNSIPVVNLASFTDMCIDAGALTLTGGTPTGGTYSGTGVAAGIFNPLTAGAGTTDIIYTVINANLCTVSDTQQITVNALPNVTIPSLGFMCINDTAITLSGALPVGGTYTGTGVLLGVFDPVVAGVGTHNITYSFTDVNGCMAWRMDSITVTGLPVVTLSTFSDMCMDATAMTLSSGLPIGGVYSGTGVASGDFDPLVSGTGTHWVTYTVTDVYGCIGLDSQSVIVNALPIVNNPIQDTVCEDVASVILFGATPMGGMYSGGNVNADTFYTVLLSSGVFDIYYSYTDVNGCSASDTGSMTIAALPIVSAGNDTTICEGNTITLTATGADSYQWSTGSQNDTAVVGPIVTSQYFVLGQDFSGCASYDTVIVSVNASPNVDLGSRDTLCADSLITLFAGPGFASYLWQDGGTTAAMTYGPYTKGQTVDFSVLVTDVNGCTGTDSLSVDIVDCSPNSILEFDNDISLNLHPNPNNGIFHLTINNWEDGDANVSLISATGSVVYQEEIVATGNVISYEFNLSNTANGLYWMVIKGDKELYRKQVLINK